MVFSVGSVTDYILNSISPFPSNISGTLSTSVNKAISRVNSWASVTLTAPIADIYFPAVSNLAFAETIKLMAIQDNGVQFVSVGDIATNNNNLKEMAKMYEENALIELKILNKGIKFKKVRG